MENSAVVTATIKTVLGTDKVNAKSFSYGSVNSDGTKSIEVKIDEKRKTKTFSWTSIDKEKIKCVISTESMPNDFKIGTFGRFLLESEIFKNPTLYTFGNSPIRSIYDLVEISGLPESLLNTDNIFALITRIADYTDKTNVSQTDAKTFVQDLQDNFGFNINANGTFNAMLQRITSLSKNVCYPSNSVPSITMKRKLKDGTELVLNIKFNSEQDKKDNKLILETIFVDSANDIKANEEKMLILKSNKTNEEKERYICQNAIERIATYKTSQMTDISLTLEEAEGKGFDLDSLFE